MPRLTRWIVLFAFWAEAALTLWSASLGGAFQGDLNRLLGTTNSMQHVLAFTVLGMTALMLWRPEWAVALALFLFALGIEAMQAFIPGRVAALHDVGASAAGILAAQGIGRLQKAVQARRAKKDG